MLFRSLAELLVSGMRLGIAAVDGVAGLTGEQRKAEVLALVAQLFDEFAGRAIPLAFYPVWILAKPAARALALSLASGAIESLLPLVRGQK